MSALRPFLCRRALSLSSRCTAKLKGKGLTAAVEEPEPVRDTKLLQTHCCGLNFMKEGQDPKLKDDSEYPDWLWTIHTGAPRTYKDYDPDTREYWYTLEEAKNKHEEQIRSGATFYRKPRDSELNFYTRLQPKKKK